MEDEVIALCFSCQTTFTTNEELLIHSCANIKDEKDELEDKNKINFIDKEHQKNFEHKISLLDTPLRNVLIYVQKMWGLR